MSLKTTLKLALPALMALVLASTPAAHAQTKGKSQPDLVVKKVEIDAKDNEIEVEVENVGQADAGPFVVRVEVFQGFKRLFTQDKTVNQLGDGDDKDVKFTVNLAQLSGGKRVRVVVRVDAANAVTEANENNNTQVRFVTP